MRKGNGVASDAPWHDQVAHLMSREGIPRDKARDHVILDYLKRGDSNALAALLIEAVKTQQAEIQQLKTQLVRLASRPAVS